MIQEPENHQSKPEEPKLAEADPNQFRCATCGHKRATDTPGDHSCIEVLRDRVNKLESASHELERRIIWAVNFMKAPGAGMMIQFTADGGLGEIVHWTTWFADGLEILGRYKVDRELLGLSKKQREKVLKARSEKEKEPQPCQESA